MNAVLISLIVFVCVFGGALIGLWLGTVLPPHHLSADSKDVMKVGMGLVGTMTPFFLVCWLPRPKASTTRRAMN